MMTEEKRPGRPRDAKRAEQRREEILAAAARFFAASGYRHADIQELADTLGVGKGTIYRYFETKEALFFATVDAGMQALTDCVDEVIEGIDDPVEHLCRAVIAYLGFFDRHPELVELLIIERAEFRDRPKGTYFIYKERNQERRREFLDKAITSGVMRDLPAEQISMVVGDALYGVIFTNHFAGRRESFEKQARYVLDILFHGMLSDRYPRPLTPEFPCDV